MTLSARVKVARRFQRAIRIDADLAHPAALQGFICPPSASELLMRMARHVMEDGQGAFTWTGTYGSGKSSLALALGAVLGPDGPLKDHTAQALGKETVARLWDALPPRKKGWRVLPVVGCREPLAQVMGEAIENTGFLRDQQPVAWTEQRVLSSLQEIAMQFPRVGGGLIVFVDEMGKFLEGAIYGETDIYFFQQLAEVASRSGKRLLLVGILHQAFEEYAYRLSRTMREEWSKVQGRFADLAFSTSGEEQIVLLAQAIESDHKPAELGSVARDVASQHHRTVSPHLARRLEDCWPLHPLVACLLGPVSQRRFSQNHRSLFGFLNSADPLGFRDFLQQATEGDLYEVCHLWDYLQINLEPSIMASPDGHRWALAADALAFCAAKDGSELHLRLLKTIALVDLVKDRSGLIASFNLLCLALQGFDPLAIKSALRELQDWSLAIYRKFNGSYSIFEGSDFDIEKALRRALDSIGEVDFDKLNEIAGFQPIVAKRHYHEKGALRWFDLALVPLRDIEIVADGHVPRHRAVGTFFLAVPTQRETVNVAERMAQRIVRQYGRGNIVVGIPQVSLDIVSLAQELLAMEFVREHTPELQGDRVARREVMSRIAELLSRMKTEMDRALDNTRWFCNERDACQLPFFQLSSLASDLAHAKYKDAPVLRNELLNRTKLSSSAAAARNALLRRMALNEGEERLGIQGFPAEGGLFASLLDTTGLYRKTPSGWRHVPPMDDADLGNLAPLWQAALDAVRGADHRTVALAEIYAIWRAPPFGVKEGMLPVLAAAFLLSHRQSLAIYRENVFQARVTDLDMDYLARDPNDIQVRWMVLSDDARHLLSDLADVVRSLDKGNALASLEPIDVARGLVSIYDQLPAWVDRTRRISAKAGKVRQLLKRANDPNRLIFDDVPQALANDFNALEEDAARIALEVREGLQELQQAYPSMLHRLRESLLTELQVPSASPTMLSELRKRAANVRQLSGNHRLESFVVRLTAFHGTDADMESLASMATNKPCRNWVDSDIDQARLNLAELAQSFIRIEGLAHVQGRTNKRQAMALVVGLNGRPTPLHEEFDVTDLEQDDVNALLSRMEKTLARSGEKRRRIILATLAELSARYISDAKVNE